MEPKFSFPQGQIVTKSSASIRTLDGWNFFGSIKAQWGDDSAAPLTRILNQKEKPIPIWYYTVFLIPIANPSPTPANQIQYFPEYRKKQIARSSHFIHSA